MINKASNRMLRNILMSSLLLVALALLPLRAASQEFDFEKLRETAEKYTVVVNIKIEISFGTHSNEHKERYLGTIVSENGLVIFNGQALGAENPMASFAGYSVKTTPTRIEVVMLDGTSYEAEFIGVDNFTRIGFLKITADEEVKFEPVHFATGNPPNVGDWFTLYMLMPEFVTPPLSVDIGMISSIITWPEKFPLTVGFNQLQSTSVMYDTALTPVGVLGALMNPTSANFEAGGLMESFGQMRFPLLGIITSDRLEKLIADPPHKGKVTRGWLGITLQALIPEIGQFWSLDIPGGIIVNDIVRNSPAEQAGLRVGDIIFEVNGQPVDVDKDERIPIFQRRISEMGQGAAVEFAVLRRTESSQDTLTLLATLEDAPMAATDAPEAENTILEFKVRDLVFSDYLHYNLDADQLQGGAVNELKQGGLAEIGGLLIGDIIQRIDNRPVVSTEDVKTIWDDIENQKQGEVIFFVWRNNKTLFVNVKTDLVQKQ